MITVGAGQVLYVGDIREKKEILLVRIDTSWGIRYWVWTPHDKAYTADKGYGEEEIQNLRRVQIVNASEEDLDTAYKSRSFLGKLLGYLEENNYQASDDEWQSFAFVCQIVNELAENSLSALSENGDEIIYYVVKDNDRKFLDLMNRNFPEARGN
jgi:hypothetical protein